MGSALGKKKPEMKISMLGLDASGKTTILYKLNGSEVETTMPTIGMNVETSTWAGMLMTVWDVGGRSAMRLLWKHYFVGSTGFVFVIDSNDRDRVEQAKDELHRALKALDDVCPTSVPLLVFANKMELPRAMSTEEVAHSLGLDRLRRAWFIQPCCAVKNEGVHEGFAWLAEAAKNPRAPGVAGSQTGVAPVIQAIERETISEPEIIELSNSTESETRTLERFAPIQSATHCPFAKRARLWGAHIEDEDLIRHLCDFVRRSEADEKLDGFVVELAGASTFSAFTDSVRRALTQLSDADPAGEGMMRKKYIGEVGWHFRFAGAPFFVTTFSPLYPSSSPRYAFGAVAAFALLQPERSFLRRGLAPDDGRPHGVRATVRAAFAEHGRPFVPPAPRSANAHQIVRPLHEGQDHVRWWEEVESLTDLSTSGGHSSDSETDAPFETANAARGPGRLPPGGSPSEGYVARFLNHLNF
jgi:small GTP-binding protein